MSDRAPSLPDTPEFHPFLERKSVWASLKEELKARFRPEKLPPLELQSKPVPVKEIWERDEGKRTVTTRATSFVVHILILTVLVLLGLSKPIQKMAVKVYDSTPLAFTPYQPVALNKTGGGGGGGTRDIHPPSRGHLPKFSMHTLAPPEVKVVNVKPLLPVTPTVMVPTNVKLAQPNLPQFGDPTAVGSVPSNGTGNGGGIGTGFGGGVGSGNGKGVGPGDNWGTGGGNGGVGGVTPPQVIYDPEPEYSEEARKAKFQGTVVLWVEIGPDGKVDNIRVKSPVGLGLDEKAVEAVKTWRFEPAKQNGRPVAVASLIEVNFRLF